MMKRTKSLFFIIYFLVLYSKTKAEIVESNLFDQLFAYIEDLPAREMIIGQFVRAINSGNLNILQECGWETENYFDTFYALEVEQKIAEFKGELLKELKVSTQELCQVIESAKTTISRIFWLTKQDFLKSKKLAGIKKLVLQTGCAGVGLASTFGTNLGESTISGLSRVLANSHFFKFGFTGLGISIFMALSFLIKSNQTKNNLARVRHLNSMIFCLHELSWQMNNAFAFHRKSLDQFLALLDQTEIYFQELWTWPSLIDCELLDGKEIQKITQLMSDELNQFNKLATQIRNDKISIMALTKAMRTLRKTQNYAIDEIILQFSDIEKLRQINPVGIDIIEDNHLFLIENYKKSHDSTLYYLIENKNAQTTDWIDLSWLEAAKNVSKVNQLFFGLNKPSYYQATIKNFIGDAEEEIGRIIK